MHRRLVAPILLALVFAVPAGAAEKLSYVDLVGRLTDFERLATMPAVVDGKLAEKGAQWSSYDRASKYDAATGKYIRWDANGDGGGIIRREPAPAGFYAADSTAKDVEVFAEITGPGVIWRTWSAAPGKGRVAMYLDGSTTPVIDLPFSQWFDGKHAPFTRPNLVHYALRGANNYVPIPFQKSCKIIAEKGWGAYYHFGYTTYPEGTQVPTFKVEMSAEENAALDRAEKVWANRGSDPYPSGAAPVAVDVEKPLPAGQAATIAELKAEGGPLAINMIKVNVLDLPAAPDDRAVLRDLALEITWDDEQQPAVWCPLGDFFGAAPGLNKYRSLPLGVADDGTMYCYWFMPFAKQARVRILNDGPDARRVKVQIRTAKVTAPAESALRFHAKWHRDAFPPADPDRAKIDWTMLKTEGAGRYVGVMLHVWNPKGGWWGEGDEKFFVDGEKFPSTIGTGSEDYFGYAWSDPHLFQNAVHNQPNNDGNNRGHLSVNRWHLSDNVPFATGFEGAIEKYYGNNRPCLFAATVYWYLAPGGLDPYKPVPAADRTNYYTNLPVAEAVKGALEGEKLKILGKTGGETTIQEMTGYEGTWSNEAHLWWTKGKVGDKLDLAVPVAKEGKYDFEVRLTKARDYGIVQVYLDGKKLSNPIDLYNPTVVGTDPILFGSFDLTAGEHKLTFEITGANEKAQKAYMVGVDWVRLTPAK